MALKLFYQDVPKEVLDDDNAVDNYYDSHMENNFSNEFEQEELKRKNLITKQQIENEIKNTIKIKKQ